MRSAAGPGLRSCAAAAAAVLLFVVLLAASWSRAEQTAEWRVIVHLANPLRSIAREELERIYRGRSRFWTDGSAILPLNLPGKDALRRAFSIDVLHDDEENLTTYWNRQYFQGIAPPAVLHSSKAVLAYVAVTPNAIGYVEAADVDSSVAVVEVAGAR